jgi:hypothetical protein
VSNGILEIPQEQEPILEHQTGLRWVDNGNVVLCRPLLQLPQKLLSLLIGTPWEYVLEFLDYYIYGLLIPSLMIVFIYVHRNECEVQIVAHQTRLPKHFDLQLCITINKESDPDSFLTW